MLSGKQRSTLKARGQALDDDARLGKGGLSEGFLASLGDALRRKELVKLRFTEVEGAERKALAEQVAQAAGAELVAVVGRTALLYRANPDLDPARRALPA